MMKIRVGFGFDVHRLVEGRQLWMGGIKIDHAMGLLGHSDADVLIHAICDAMLGAASMRDIGYHFPDTAAETDGIDSKVLLAETLRLVASKGYSVGNIDATICAERPKMNPHIPAMKACLLNHLIDTIRGTLHRQTMFAEFEFKAHALAEKGEPLTKELLCETYGSIGKDYYGDAIEHDYNISCEWSRIPHFYRAFYVYKYATGITAAINIAHRILSEGKCAVNDYFKFLSSGSSSDPVSLLKLAGVDLESKAPFEFAMREFADTLSEFEKMMKI